MKTIYKYFVVIFLFFTIITESYIVRSQTKLKDINGNFKEYSKESLKNLLCNSNWTFGYSRIDFRKNYTYETGVQDTWEGKWKMTDEGTILVLPAFEGNDIWELHFLNTYTLSDNLNNPTHYSDVYYEVFEASEESKKAIRKNLSEITKNDIIGIWVTDEQGPMGELLGFKFTENSFEFGRPGLEMLFGCWDDAEYEDVGTWRYDKTNKTIIISRTGYENMGNIEIKLNKFFNGAFEGIIMPEYYYDEVGVSIRTFWKSECR